MPKYTGIFLKDNIYCTIIYLSLSTGNAQEQKTHRQGSTILASLFANFSFEQNLWPSSNKLASCSLSLKRTTAASKGLDFGSIDVFTLRRRPFPSHSGASGLVVHVWVAQFCLVRVPTQSDCKIYPCSWEQSELRERPCLIETHQSSPWSTILLLIEKWLSYRSPVVGVKPGESWVFKHCSDSLIQLNTLHLKKALFCVSAVFLFICLRMFLC